MSQSQHRTIFSFFALFCLGYVLLVFYSSGLSLSLLFGSALGVVLGIGGCFATYRAVSQQQKSSSDQRGGALIGIGVLISMVLPALARLLGMPESIAGFIVVTLGICMTLFFLWIGWFFEPPHLRYERRAKKSDRWQPPSDAERDEERWRH